MNKKRLVALVLAFALVLSLTFALVACGDKGDGQTSSKVVRISTTTSVNDSGLMAYLQPYFEKDTGYKWEISSAGTGAAIASATYGNADVILVHSKSAEEEFVEDGFARKVDGYTDERISFMYNYFVLVGPSGTNDIAGVSNATGVKDAFAKISSTANAKFISRGDKSGTHNAEIKLWPDSLKAQWGGGSISNDITKIPTDILYNEDTNPSGFYISAGAGMGACLTMANEMSAYCLTDKATFLSYKKSSEGDKLQNLSILFEQDNDMKNTYSMLAVKADAPFVSSIDNSLLTAGSVKINVDAANVFINWMNSVQARYLISQYGISQYQENLFTLQSLNLTYTES